MLHIASRLNRIRPSPSSMAGQRVRELRAQGRDIVGLTAGEPVSVSAPVDNGDNALARFVMSKNRIKVDSQVVRA